LGGHFKGIEPSELMKKEVFKSMISDKVGKTAQSDQIIVALGESWLRRNIGNEEKRRHYSSQRMRLSARLLIHLRTIDKENQHEQAEGGQEVDEEEEEPDVVSESENKKTLSEFLKPEHFDKIVTAAIRCCLPYIDDIEDLASPSNALKLKYDLKRLINAKWALITKKDALDPEAKLCRKVLKLMDVEWDERVTRLARSILTTRKFYEKTQLPSPEDVQKLTDYLVKTIRETKLETENFRRVATIVQARILLYNKRRSGEVDAIK
jgi:hypothetical protein